MTDLQDISDLDIYEPYYYEFYDYYPNYYYSIPDSGYLCGFGTGSDEPHGFNSLFKYHNISYVPCDRSTPSKSHSSFLAKRGSSSYGQRDYSDLSDDELCEYDPIPVGRSGYAYRRRYSCRPITSDPRWYGSKTYYPPSYWMERNRYYGPC